MTAATVIRNADWVVAWNEAKSTHVYLRDGDVAFAGSEIVSVGGPLTSISIASPLRSKPVFYKTLQF